MGQNRLPTLGSAAGLVPRADERPEQTGSGRGCAAAGVPEVGPRDARARAVGNAHCCPPRLERGTQQKEGWDLSGAEKKGFLFHPCFVFLSPGEVFGAKVFAPGWCLWPRKRLWAGSGFESRRQSGA